MKYKKGLVRGYKSRIEGKSKRSCLGSQKLKADQIGAEPLSLEP